MGEDIFKLEYLFAFSIYILVIFSVLILHEIGHYLAARAFGMTIKDVVVGRGKFLKSWKNKRDIEWRLHLFPISAHVHIDDIEQRPFYQKIITILAGPLINFAVILPLFFSFYLAFGQPSIPNIVVGVEQNLAADKAGIKPGDRFVAVNGIPLSNFDDIWRIAYKRGAVESTYTVQRGEEIFDVAIKPNWAEYEDLSGILRKNARFGVVWEHAAFALDSILSVGGQNVKDDENRARASLIKNFDKSVLIEIEGPEDEVRPIRINLRGEHNQGLLDKDDDFYKAAHFGTTKGNVYMPGTTMENLTKASRYSIGLLKNIAKVPFQIFPIDKSEIQDGAAVTNDETKITNRIYKILHLFAVTSVVIGLINLLPFPSLDGGQLIDQTLRRICGDKLTNKRRANIFAVAFLVLYASIFIANMDNLHGYIDSSIKKVHELVDDNSEE